MILVPTAMLARGWVGAGDRNREERKGKDGSEACKTVEDFAACAYSHREYKALCCSAPLKNKLCCNMKSTLKVLWQIKKMM